MESDSFYEDFMLKLIWKLSGNLITTFFHLRRTADFSI